MSQKSPISKDINYDQDGKQQGVLKVPQSTNSSGWRTEFIPITVLKNGEGPTALLCGGNHGDEHIGQVALMNLVREMHPHQIQGRLIVLPMLNKPSVRSGTRLSPLDGKNMNREFPGNPEGTITSMIAHYVSSELMPLSDFVVDIHSGGRAAKFLPSVNMHQVSDRVQMQAMLEAGKAWGAPYVFIYRDVGGTGLLPGYAEQLGKVTLGTELGSASQFGVDMIQLSDCGLKNVLRHWGILEGEREAPEKEPEVVGATEADDYVMAPVSGVFEPFKEMGDALVAGEPIGQIHSIELPHLEPTRVSALTDGFLMSRRAFPLVDQGDCLATVVRPFQL